jgi:hypothetical protein
MEVRAEWSAPRPSFSRAAREVMFSVDSYRRLLRTGLDAGFKSRLFTERPSPDRALLLRHDVDYSLDMALRLAALNADMGVIGTFFVLLRGHAYNPVSKASLERLDKMASFGQRLGLHVAGGSEDRIDSDFAFLSTQIPLDPVFSWHNPSPELIQANRVQEMVGGLTNVYSTRFLDDADYLSDSNFRNTFDQLAAGFAGSRSAVHLLLHPINWVAGGDSMSEVFEHAWPYLIRECELEARTNREYSAALPSGIPDSVLVEFSRLWREAAS